MIRGFVNEKLVPIVPVGVKKLDGDWQKLDILLDTGSEVDCMLAETTVGQYGIAIRHRYDSPVSVGSVQILGNLNTQVSLLGLNCFWKETRW